MVIKTAKDIGALVRDLRKRQSLTQAALAARVGASRKWLIDLEAGKPTADLSLALRTMRALGVAIDVQTPQSAPAPASSVDVDALIERHRGPRRSGHDG